MSYEIGPKDLKTDTVVDPEVLKSAREGVFPSHTPEDVPLQGVR